MVFKTNLLVSILFTLSTNLSWTIYLITSFFTTSLNLLKSTETGANLSISNWSTSVFWLAKFAFNAKLEVSTCVTFSRSVFDQILRSDQLEKSTLTLIPPPNGSYGFGKYCNYTYLIKSFLSIQLLNELS